jgi:predicted nucleic-acid-binding protein
VIGLDTSVLVRYQARYDPIQSPLATTFIEQRLDALNPGFTGIVAMAETVWVLDRAYRLTATEVAAAIERLLQVDALVVENEQAVFTAMIALKTGRGSFADALIAELGAGAGAGCSHTVIFDPKALAIERLWRSKGSGNQKALAIERLWRSKGSGDRKALGLPAFRRA